jgi:serine/threonine protein kinase/tetratricopeptide (TPR) repeat protein
MRCTASQWGRKPGMDFVAEPRKCSRCGAELAADTAGDRCERCGRRSDLTTEASPVGHDRTLSLSIHLTEKPGDKISHYKLLQQIGEGGCGVVYMAEQEEPVRRRVALKVIKLGMDTKQVIARFEAERQALALMDHPNIAKVLDAGATETGRPFFVMELVRGIRITDYCDQNNLSTRDRLGLFVDVCRAIQHAHQKGVIHRDIKPSNILVTSHDGVPLPKVIDFGIAKATNNQRLTDKTLFTAFEQFIGTPAYMSPEQAEMSALDVDTRSDIYALGVLLYELLTGRTPFDAKRLLEAGFDEIRRIIREEEPPRPSTRISTLDVSEQTTVARHQGSEPPRLIHLVAGDLDWIVMKAMEKDRTRRYETANGLAVDIARFLCDEPIVARPPSSLYRFQKLVRRNKLAVAAATAVICALILGLGIATWQFLRERQARQRAVAAEQEQVRLRHEAETEAAKSRQVAQFLKDMLQGVGPSVALGRDTTMLREIVDKTADHIGKDLKDQPEVEIELRLTLAQVYFDLELYKKMEETARETLRLAQAHFGEENLAAADALGQIGRALVSLREVDESEVFTRRAIAMQRKLRGEDSLQEADALCNLSEVLDHRAGLNKDQQDIFNEAETACRECLRIRRKRLGNGAGDVGWALATLGNSLQRQGKLAEAESAAREALAIDQKVYGAEHSYAAHRASLLGTILWQEGKAEEAETYLHKALEIAERIEGKGKLSQLWFHYNLAEALQMQTKLDEAEIHYREAVTIATTEMDADWADLPLLIADLAACLCQNGKLGEARPFAEEAVALCQRHPGRIESWIRDRAFDSLRDVLTSVGDTAALEKLELAVQKTDTKPKLSPTPEPSAN